MSIQTKKWLLRLFSLCLFVFFNIFGGTNKKTGFCLGDRIFENVGLNAWSKGTHGTHYPGVIALIFMAISFYIFASTTLNKKRTIILLILLGSGLSTFLSFIY